MANATQSVLGALNKAVSNTAGSQAYDTKYATYLKLFSGELFKAYESATIAKGTVQNRQLKNGKSLQFIFTGRMQAAYHTPGEPILGSGDPPVAEKTIVCDDLLISSAFVYDLDETLAHYSLRSEISKKIGHALAEAYDKKVFRTIALAAREAHPITASPGPEPGGSVIKIGANNEYDAQKLVDLYNEAGGHQVTYQGGNQMDAKNMDWFYRGQQDTDPSGALASRYGSMDIDLNRIQQSFETLQSMSAIKDDRVMKHVKKGYSINSYNDIRSFSMSVGITTQDVHGIMATQGDWNVVAKQWNVSPIIVKATKVTFGGV